MRRSERLRRVPIRLCKKNPEEAGFFVIYLRKIDVVRGPVFVFKVRVFVFWSVLVVFVFLETLYTAQNLLRWVEPNQYQRISVNIYQDFHMVFCV